MNLLSFFTRKKPKVNGFISDSIANSQLIHCYTDIFGNKYYEFPDPMAMGVLRFTSAGEATKYAEFNITKERFIELNTLIIDSFNKKTPDLVAIALAAEEMRACAQFSAEKITLLNLACVYFIREDENPNSFDANIQKEKKECWEKDENALIFFLERAWQYTKVYHKLLDTDSAKSLIEMEQTHKYQSIFFK